MLNILLLISIIIGLIYLVAGTVNKFRDDNDDERAYKNMALAAYILGFICLSMFIILLHNPPIMY
jgi:formate hydrogenlyase subunit 3/multisubunit Na+/H+ antiporter MnhD subunit